MPPVFDISQAFYEHIVISMLEVPRLDSYLQILDLEDKVCKRQALQRLTWAHYSMLKMLVGDITF